jgi:hypothetical protein
VSFLCDAGVPVVNSAATIDQRVFKDAGMALPTHSDTTRKVSRAGDGLALPAV